MRPMRGAEYGFLLLTSSLGDPARRPMTVAQFRTLTKRVQLMDRGEVSRDIRVSDLTAVGYSASEAERIISLLSQEALLRNYLTRAEKLGCVPITRVTEGYPYLVRKRLGIDSPGCLWARGDLSLLQEPAVALVGSRDLEPCNREFAEEVGRQAARQFFALVSGNARGADSTAQNACLAAGGRVISVVADELVSHSLRENVLYLSEYGFDEPFSAQRALSRNRVIHTMGAKTFVAQSDSGKGGTWSGTAQNLKNRWSPVYCCDDGSEAMARLRDMGAFLINKGQLASFYELPAPELSLFDR